MPPEAPERPADAPETTDLAPPEAPEGVSGPSDDDSDSDNRSISAGRSSDSEEEQFFRDPTISQDDTFRKDAQNKHLLAKMGDQIDQDCEEKLQKLGSYWSPADSLQLLPFT